MNFSSLSFAAFMEQALYDPEHGYYASGRARIGKTGDFFTNVSVGKIYGKILALFFQDLWEKMEKPTCFTIVEQGANDGRLAADILEAAKSSSAFFSALHYTIVEPFSLHQKKQQEILKDQKNISWVETMEDLASFEGVHFSNELIDAFPVHLLRWNGEEWQEQRVSTTKGSAPYSWITAPIEQKELRAVAEKLPTTLAPGFLWEVRLGVTPWLKQLSTKLQRGMILIADYGYAGSQRFAPYRAQGSIACYQDHRRYDNPLEEMGKRDITAHVDFTDLAEQARQQSFEVFGYTDQHHFLIGAAEEWLKVKGQSLNLLISQKAPVNKLEPKLTNYGTDPLLLAAQKEFRLLQTLLHPETMGRAFQFLGLGKNLQLLSPLTGFRYQRPGINALNE